MSDFDIDLSEVIIEADRLDKVGDKIMPAARPVLIKGAVNVKNQLQSEARESSHFGKIGGLINFEQRIAANTAEAEIGPQKRGAGNLANIAYFGGIHGGGGTLPDPELALKAEAPKFVEQLAQAMTELLS